MDSAVLTPLAETFVWSKQFPLAGHKFVEFVRQFGQAVDLQGKMRFAHGTEMPVKTARWSGERPTQSGRWPLMAYLTNTTVTQPMSDLRT